MTDNNNNNNLKETKDYLLTVGEGVLEKDFGKVYLVINKKTNVTEVETRLLPQAFAFIEQLQANLDGYRDTTSQIKTGPDIQQSLSKLSKVH